MICHSRGRSRAGHTAPTPSPTPPPVLGRVGVCTKTKGAAIKVKTSEELTGKRRPAEDVYTKHYGNEINMADTPCCTHPTKTVLPPSLRAFHTLLHHGKVGGVSPNVVEVEKTRDREEYRGGNKKMTHNSVFPPSSGGCRVLLEGSSEAVTLLLPEKRFPRPAGRTFTGNVRAARSVEVVVVVVASFIV